MLKLNLKDKREDDEEEKEVAKEKKKEETVINYYKWKPKEEPKEKQQPQSNATNENENEEFVFDDRFSHIIELYEFPTNFKNENLMNAIKDKTYAPLLLNRVQLFG